MPASRPYRTTWISQFGPFRRAATISGQPARLRTRWNRAAVRTSVSSRRRIVAASSNRCWPTSRCNRPRSACTAGRASAGEGLPDLLDDLGVAVPGDGAVAGRAAPAHPGQRTGARRRVGTQPRRALPDRESVVDREHDVLGRLPPAERTEVGRAVVAHGAHHREPWEGLFGDLDPLHPLGELRAAVVAGRVPADQPELGHVGLQRRQAGQRLDSGGQPDHLVDPRPLLGRGEVGAHPGPDVHRLADVQHVPLLVVLGDEQVDPGPLRQVGGPGPLGPALRRHPPAELRQVLDGLHTEVAHPFDQSVQHVDGGLGVGQGPMVGGDSGTGSAGPGWPAGSSPPRRPAGSAGPGPRCPPPASAGTDSRRPRRPGAGSRRRTVRCGPRSPCRARR